MLNDLKVKVAVSWSAAHAIPGRSGGLGKDRCIRRPHVVATMRGSVGLPLLNAAD